MSPDRRRVLLQIILFIVTVITTTHAGSEWTYLKSILLKGYTWADFVSGFEFSIPFLLILTVHEFGHYFTARYHGVPATLPYYIPLPPVPLWIGTMGAVIRLKARIYSNKENFDIGIAGPLAGFVTALVILFYGFTHLPEPEYIFKIHPEYEKYGLDYAEHVYNKTEGMDVMLGSNLIFSFFEHFVADSSRMPNPHEMMHYPLLLAGFLALVFTSVNLLPIGQMDGGHVSYGLFGFKNHKRIATVIFIMLVIYSGVGFVNFQTEDQEMILWKVAGATVFLYIAMTGLKLSKRDTLMYTLIIIASLVIVAWRFPKLEGYYPWQLLVLMIGRFVGIEHPPAEIEEPLDTKRVALGWLALIIFIISFSPSPIMIK